MALELRQNLRLSQQLVMTPQLQQAIKLLQLSRLELAETIRQELEINPVLEEGLASADDDGPELDLALADKQEPAPAELPLDSPSSSSSLAEIDWSNYINEYANEQPDPSFATAAHNDEALPSRLDILTTRPSLQAHLKWQLNFAKISEEERKVGDFIIGNLDANGFLKVEFAEICAQSEADPALVNQALALIWAMDPAGVGAFDLGHCLLLQLDRLNLADSLAAQIVREHLNLLSTRRYSLISKVTGRSLAEVTLAINIITNLNPRPGRLYFNEDPVYVVPDIYLHKLGEDYLITLNDDGLPRLKIANYYKEILNQHSLASAATKDYVQNKLRSAMWLIKAIQQRQRTIHRVMASILKFQRDFFEHGVQRLKPLVLRDVAEDIGMHESTISRVTSNKYVDSPQGIFELKYFFNPAISTHSGQGLAAESIKQRLKSLIARENPQKPLSDELISRIFKQEKIRLARRTVVKYREQLGILPSKLRRQP